MINPFVAWVAARPLIFWPGALGTELQRRGFATRLPLWSAAANLDDPALVQQIYADYLIAGADVLITNSFRTIPRTYEKIGQPELAQEATVASVVLARAAQAVVQRTTWVGGSLAPLEDCYEPSLVPDSQSLALEHCKQAKILADAGCDFMMIETINCVREAVATTQATVATNLPFFISFVVNADGNLLSGETLEEAVLATEHPNRLGVLLNCRPFTDMAVGLEKLAAIDVHGRKGFYANGAGKPADDLGWTFDCNNLADEDYVGQARHWHGRGFDLIGGCCGTTPSTIAKLCQKLKADSVGEE
jgi:homocysteine S-methyltransferase